jgi:membrane protein implicated in regulation of membrane protease activity
MNKPVAIFTIFFALAVITFGTWQLFKGNLEAAFSTFPFLLIIYIFVKPFRT